ncbi:uncharacterized protein LOC114293911 [Camellia sinensis]|uniref:uncharacterized protein LOC114293911 n=1 Tax=Camellia sinensis TaxID=4442 RepID=UPI00103597BC|nr:uncharacterized protein LOC114293911 [Camellia sinensis]
MMKDYLIGFENTNHPVANSGRYASAPRTNIRASTTKEAVKQGCVFAFVSGDVLNTETMVSGILFTCAQNAYVLIDSGSMHSFVSHAFSRKLTRPLESMNYLLYISTLSGGSMVCAYVYPAYDNMIGDMLLYVDFLPLDIAHFDCILGMDWLTKYCATIDCVNKSVVFRSPNLPEFLVTGNGIVPSPYLISTMKANKLLRKGCQGYLCCVLIVSTDSMNIENIPIVNDFLDVFPNDLPGDLIDREIEFTIDIIPGTQPISKTPYRMSTSKLKELKIQLQELLDKKFIRPSTSH